MLFAILIIIVLIAIILICIYNAMLKRKNKVNTAFSSLDVMLKRRYDLMPNLVSIVKTYMTHESELLTTLTELRTKIENSKSINESIHLNSQFENAIKKLNISMENYPELNSNQNFLHMQSVLNEVEEQISAARRNYNAHVEAYNTFIGMIPLNLLAKLFNFKYFKLFEISEEERENKKWM